MVFFFKFSMKLRWHRAWGGSLRKTELHISNKHTSLHSFSMGWPLTSGCSGRTGLQHSPFVPVLAWKTLFFWKKRTVTVPSHWISCEMERLGQSQVGAGAYPGLHSAGCLMSTCPKAGVPASLEPSCWSRMHHDPRKDSMDPPLCPGAVSQWDHRAVGGCGECSPGFGLPHSPNHALEDVCHLPQRQIKSFPELLM